MRAPVFRWNTNVSGWVLWVAAATGTGSGVGTLGARSGDFRCAHPDFSLAGVRESGRPRYIYSGISCSKPCGNCGQRPHGPWPAPSRNRRPPRCAERSPTRTTRPPTTTIPADPPSSTDDGARRNPTTRPGNPRALDARAHRAHPENRTSRSKTRRSDEGMPYWHPTEEETGPPVAAGDPVEIVRGPFSSTRTTHRLLSLEQQPNGPGWSRLSASPTWSGRSPMAQAPASPPFPSST